MKHAIVLASLATAAALAAAPQEGTPSQATPAEVEQRIGTVREVLDRWVDTRRVIADEEREFALAKDMLAARIDLVQRDIDGVRGKVKEAEASITEADRRRDELVAQSDRLKTTSESMQRTIEDMERRTRALLARIPDPIRERVKPLSQRVPAEGAESKLALAVRFQNVIGILNEVNKFNREITMTSEVRQLPDGSSAEVTALYIGIAQGFYVNGAGTVAGIGGAGADGWTWRPANDAAPRIAAVVAILKNEQPAEFIELPIKVD
ncbi:MAG: DUF3450 family protein [Planctomycetota bacterium]